MAAMVLFRFLLLAPAAAKLCEKNLVPCISLSDGVQMPMMALGSWRGSYKDCASSNYSCAQDRARTSLQYWLQELNGTHVDSANDYRTQVQVGEAIRAAGVKREEVFVTTKRLCSIRRLFHQLDSWRDGVLVINLENRPQDGFIVSWTKRYIMCPGAIGYNATLQCVEDNLQMLGFYGDAKPYLDLVLVHFPFAVKPECMGPAGPGCEVPFYDPGREVRRETWAAMEFVKRMGRARAIGVSNYKVEHFMEILDLQEIPAVNQVEWHPFHHDDQLKAFCSAHGIRLQAWSPLSGQNGSALSDATVQAIASSHGKSPAQVVLRWALQQDVSVVVGTDNQQHMRTDLQLFDFNLSHSELRKISELKAESDQLLV